MSQFSFLSREWAAVFEAASKAEGVMHADPRTACFHARRALELAVGWAFTHDAALRANGPEKSGEPGVSVEISLWRGKDSG